MQIELNGQPYQLEHDHNIQALITKLNLNHQAIAVAVNRQIIPPQQWVHVLLTPADTVDVVEAVTGG